MKTLRSFLLWALPLFAAHSLSAVDGSKRISQYAHTAWRMQDGYFSGAPHAITQTADGYIWVGTQNELIRFDGVQFTKWHPPAGNQLPPSRIWRILGSSDGSLWIGTDSGLAHWNNRELVVLPDALGQITSIIEKPNGEIWFSHIQRSGDSEAVCQVINDRTKCYGNSAGVPLSTASALAEDKSGNFWFGDMSTVVRWNGKYSRKYSPRALERNQADGVTAIVAGPDKSVWVGFAIRGPGLGLQKVENDVLKPFVTPELDSSTLIVNALLFDRQGSLWIGTSKGIYRIRGGIVDHFGRTDGLSSDFVTDLFEDREGDMWVATSRGIDCFRDLRVTSFTGREGLQMDEVDSVTASRDGTVWAGGPETLSSIRGGRVSSIQLHKGLPGNQVTSLFEDHAGRLWVGVDNSLFVYEKRTFRPITKPNGDPVGFVADIKEDGNQNIWIETIGPPRTLLRIANFTVQEEFPESKMPAARKIAVARDGSIWLGLLSGDLARYKDKKLNIFRYKNSQAPDLDSRVNELLITSDGAVLGATSFGVIAWKDEKQQILTVANGLPCNVVYSLISDNNGALWLYSQCGIVEIPNAEIQKWWADRNSVLQIQTLTAVDGAQPGRVPFSGAVRSADGRLWFANYTSLQVIDPGKMKHNSIPPPVHVQNIIANHRTYNSKGVLLPAKTRDIQIDYTALSFSNPKKVIFRYKLEGRDGAWEDAGTRRQAFYTDLPPGRYVFRVIASNDDGVWNQNGAAVDFRIAAAWYQTTWFRILGGVGLLLVLWGIYQVRLRRLAWQFNTRLEERLAERTRIARELHDTLLQNLHAVMYEFQAAKNLLYKNPRQAEKTLESAIVGTEQAIEESQHAIEELRSPQVIESDFVELLTEFGKELTKIQNTTQNSPAFRVIVEGTRRSLSPVVQNEVYGIARETIRNSCHHAEASEIEAEVRYDRHEFRLRIRDNGKGISREVLEAGRRAGHWGLPGIHERAQRIGAKLDLWSETGAGTEVQLIVPAAVAYKKSPTLRKFRIFNKDVGA